MEIFENVDLEQNILAAMVLRGGEKIPAVLKDLTVADFTDERNRILFSHIVGLYLRGGNPEHDQVTLIEEMKSVGDFDKVGVEYFTNVVHRTTYTNMYIEGHVRMLKEKTNLRRLKMLGQKITNEAETGQKTVAEIISDVSNEFSGFTAADVGTRFTIAKDYFTNDFESEIEQAKRYALRSTGFSNIDENQIFGPGVYVLGAVPACGKTTFAWQLADQLARKGETCVYCSYEMSRLELFSKSIARKLFLRDKSAKLTAAEIRRGGVSAKVKEIVKEKQNDNSDLRVLELHDETIDDLLRMLRPLCTGKGKSPVVFIDYLQIVPSTKDNTKNGIDDTVRKLKVFQRATDTTFIVISSFNRTNYNQTVSFESFKESGSIEFTADCVWGLQLNVMNEFKKRNDDLSGAIREKVEEAKRQQPRQIQLKCLKNRQGTNYDCYFKYYSAHDYFEACKDFSEKNNLGW